MSQRRRKKVVMLFRPPSRDGDGKILIAEGDLWVEKAHRDAVWVVADVRPETEGSKKKRVFIMQKDGTPGDRSYSESYFRRHWEILYEHLRKENKSRQDAPTKADVIRMVSSR